jgi:hypothetical protein
LGEVYASVAESFAGLAEGACAVQSYTVPVGGQRLNVPTIGSNKVELFAVMEAVSQASVAAAPAALGPMRLSTKIYGARCGQATLGEKFASAPKFFAGMLEGTCAVPGCTVLAGDQTLR